MIFGIGADIVRVARMQKSLDRYGEKFAQRILTNRELEEYVQDAHKAHFLAKRFAAKEAAAKAMGTGFQNGVQLKQISVCHTEHGKPLLEFSGFAASFMDQHKILHAHLSLTDEKDNAVAFVVLETN